MGVPKRLISRITAASSNQYSVELDIPIRERVVAV